LAPPDSPRTQLGATTTPRHADFFTVAGYASLHGVKWDLKQASGYGRKASKLSRDQGYTIGQINDPRFGQVNTYHVDILKVIVPSLGPIKIS